MTDIIRFKRIRNLMMNRNSMPNLEYDNNQILKLLKKAKNSIGTSTLTIDNNILRAIGFEGIQYILQNKVQFSGMLDNVDSIKINYLNKNDFDDFKEFILSTVCEYDDI